MQTELLIKEFFKIFPDPVSPVIIRSPGRVNIIGEHTDYNDGFVLPAAIDKAVYLAISLRNDSEIHLFAKDLNESFTGRVDNLDPTAQEGWPNYVLGVVAQFVKAGIPLKGFNAMLTSDLPIGAGLSSSAAVECAVAFGLDHLLQSGFDKLQLVRMAQKAEHEYAGVLCGIMDQFASMMGKKDHVIKLDCRSLEYEYVPFKLDGYKILLLNTNIKHALASSEYNTRRRECDQAVEWIRKFEPAVQSLRDVNEAMLDKYVLPKDKLIDKRARFVVQEIIRLLNACEDLKKGDIHALGQKMFATHYGLSEMYEVSCKELDWLVNKVKNKEAVLGARMMGGGFGGCTINLVKEDAVEKIVAEIQPAYEKANGSSLSYYIVDISTGTKIL